MDTLGTTILLGIVFESFEVLDVLMTYFAKSNENVNFQLPMSIVLHKFVQIISSHDERKWSYAIVDSTHRIRAICSFQLENMGAVAKSDSLYWELLKTSISTKASTRVLSAYERLTVCAYFFFFA